MLSRKHYIEVAKIFASHSHGYKPETIEARTATWFAQELADVYAADNPAFDRAGFLAACGVQS